MSVEEWVKRLNDLSERMDEIAASVHPSVAFALTEDLRETYRALAQKDPIA